MGTFRYEAKDDKYVVKDNKQFTVFDADGLDANLIKRYRELLAQKHDLERANAYLEQMFFEENTTLIDGALINGAIQLLVRCFTSSSKEDRLKFDETKVFKKYAVEIGEEDLFDKYEQFYIARNKVVSHDEINYHNNVIGITVDSAGTAQDIAEITIATTYVYKENRDLLKRLCGIALQYANNQLDELKIILLRKYNECDPKPNLSILDISKLKSSVAWNIW